jgi:hypothetical protein
MIAYTTGCWSTYLYSFLNAKYQSAFNEGCNISRDFKDSLCQTAFFLFVVYQSQVTHHLQLVPSEKYSYLLHSSTPARVSISSAAAAAASS